MFQNHGTTTKFQIVVRSVGQVASSNPTRRFGNVHCHVIGRQAGWGLALFLYYMLLQYNTIQISYRITLTNWRSRKTISHGKKYASGSSCASGPVKTRLIIGHDPRKPWFDLVKGCERLVHALVMPRVYVYFLLALSRGRAQKCLCYQIERRADSDRVRIWRRQQQVDASFCAYFPHISVKRI